MQSFYPSLCEALGENPSDKDYYSPDIQSSDDYSPSETESDTEAEDEHEEELMLSAEGEPVLLKGARSGRGSPRSRSASPQHG